MIMIVITTMNMKHADGDNGEDYEVNDDKDDNRSDSNNEEVKRQRVGRTPSLGGWGDGGGGGQESST